MFLHVVYSISITALIENSAYIIVRLKFNPIVIDAEYLSADISCISVRICCIFAF